MTYTEISQHIYLGISSSFVGALPLGMLNLTVLQLSLAQRHRQAIAFSIGAIVIEFFQIGITLLSINVLLQIPYLNPILSLISIPILAFLGIKYFKDKEKNKKPDLRIQSAFYQGVTLSLANVLVYPFWLLWGHIFIQNNWLLPLPAAFGFFSLGAALGTFSAFLIFILLGKILWQYLSQLQNIINQLIGFAFLAFASFQFYALVTKVY
jgi:threonine/homoserine/homoserine lactone efflux protein